MPTMKSQRLRPSAVNRLRLGPGNTATPVAYRRNLLKALAACPLVGCSGVVNEQADFRATRLDDEPRWTSPVPNILFAKGRAATYDLTQHTSGFNPAVHRMVLTGGSAALGHGVMLDPSGVIRYDGHSNAGEISGLVIEIKDSKGAGSTAPTALKSDLMPFAARAAQQGVVRHFAFDSPLHLGSGPGGFGYGHNYGWYPGSDKEDHPVLDTSVFPGTSGSSLKLTMDEQRNGGLWVCNFSDSLDVRFNAGDEFFVQWRQRFNAAMIGPNVDRYGSWKQCLISSGDVNYTTSGIANSCRCIEICLTSYQLSLGADDAHNDRFPIAYHRCPSCGVTVNLTEKHPGQFLLLQNKRPAPYCGYNNLKPSGPGVSPPGGNCFTYVADEWMTFQVGVTCGARVGEELPNSRVRVWAQREGRGSELLIDNNLTLTFPSNDPGYGKFWFTARNPYKRNTTMVTWLAELIISRQKLPDAL